MGSRDRPGSEAKKKPKAKLGQPKLSPLSEPPPNGELIRKPRKEKPVDEDDGRGLIAGRTPWHGLSGERSTVATGA